MKKIILTLIAGVFLAAGAGFIYPALAEAPVVECQFSSDFALQECEQECRSWFGVDPYGWYPGGGDRGTYWAYSRCIQDCNTAFWDKLDRETEELLP